jgi:hypothetical protein
MCGGPDSNGAARSLDRPRLNMEASRALTAKIDAARAVAAAARAADVPGAAAAADKIERLAADYCLAIASATLARGDEPPQVAAAGGYASEIDCLVARLEAAARAAGVPLRGAERRGRHGAADYLQRALDGFPRAPVAPEQKECEYAACGCGAAMAVDSSRSELYCVECGAVRKLEGVAFDANQFHCQEGQKAKSGNFNPNRHFHNWMQRILAKEPEKELGRSGEKDNEYGEQTLKLIREKIDADKSILLRLLTVQNVRKILMEIGRSDLNKNIALIMKKITRIGPPELSEDLLARTDNMFTKAILVYEELRPDGRVNRNYYPYYIRRILELLIPETDLESRRVFWYIYVQSEDTVASDDETWRRICERLQERGEKEFVYKPTDRNLGEKYPPV